MNRKENFPNKKAVYKNKKKFGLKYSEIKYWFLSLVPNPSPKEKGNTILNFWLKCSGKVPRLWRGI